MFTELAWSRGIRNRLRQRSSRCFVSVECRISARIDTMDNSLWALSRFKFIHLKYKKSIPRYWMW